MRTRHIEIGRTLQGDTYLIRMTDSQQGKRYYVCYEDAFNLMARMWYVNLKDKVAHIDGKNSIFEADDLELNLEYGMNAEDHERLQDIEELILEYTHKGYDLSDLTKRERDELYMKRNKYYRHFIGFYGVDGKIKRVKRI